MHCADRSRSKAKAESECPPLNSAQRTIARSGHDPDSCTGTTSTVRTQAQQHRMRRRHTDGRTNTHTNDSTRHAGQSNARFCLPRAAHRKASVCVGCEVLWRAVVSCCICLCIACAGCASMTKTVMVYESLIRQTLCYFHLRSTNPAPTCNPWRAQRAVLCCDMMCCACIAVHR